MALTLNNTSTPNMSTQSNSTYGGLLNPNPSALNPISLGQSLNPNNTSPQPVANMSTQSTSGLLNPHASLASNLGAGPVTSISTTTNPDGSVKQTTQHATTPSAGTYKGVAITPGTDAEIAQQVAAIDAGDGGTSQNTGTTAGTTAGTGATLSTTGTTGTTLPSTTSPTSTTPPVSTTPGNPYIADIAGAGATTQAEQNATAQQIATLRTNLASGIGGIASQPETLSFGSGRQNALVNEEANKETALQGQLQSQIAAGTQNIGALGAAGALAQPSTVAPGQAVFNPATGQYTSASSGGGNPSTAPSGIDQTSWDNYVSMAANGQYSAIPSSITSNTNLSGQLNQAALAKNPNYSPITSTAQGTATAQNTTTAGTASTQAALSAYVSAYPQVQQLNQSLNNITSLGNMTVQNATGNNVNPFAAAPANATLAQVRTGLSDAGQVTFNSNMAQLQQSIQALYAGSGGNTPTGVQSAIGQLADGTLSVSGLQALLSAAQAEGKLLLGNATATATAEYQATQSGNSGSSNNSSSNSSTSGFGWNG